MSMKKYAISDLLNSIGKYIDKEDKKLRKLINVREDLRDQLDIFGRRYKYFYFNTLRTLILLAISEGIVTVNDDADKLWDKITSNYMDKLPHDFKHIWLISKKLLYQKPMYVV